MGIQDIPLRTTADFTSTSSIQSTFGFCMTSMPLLSFLSSNTVAKTILTLRKHPAIRQSCVINMYRIISSLIGINYSTGATGKLRNLLDTNQFILKNSQN